MGNSQTFKSLINHRITLWSSPHFNVYLLCKSSLAPLTPQLLNVIQELEQYRSSQQDRIYHFWERRPYKATMYNRKVAFQKIDYMHYNPVKAGLCKLPEEYKYSSCRFYELNRDEWGFITHYEEHL